MKILVTGGTGLIGNGIRLAVERSEHFQLSDFIFVSSKDCNFCNEEETLVYFQRLKPSFVIHLAAKVGGLFSNMNDNLSFLTENMKINMNVLDAAYKTGVTEVLCCLSTCIFPDDTSYPIQESFLHNGPPHKSNYGYSYAKRMLKILCDAYNEKHATNFKTFIPTNVFGPYDNYRIDQAHVIPSLMHKAMKNQELVVYGSGRPLRQFIYSIDLGRLILLLMTNYKSNDSIILSVPESEEVSIKQVANLIAENFENKNIIYDTSYADGQYKKTVSTAKLFLNFPNFKFTPLKQAIKESCEWLKNNKDIARL